MNKDCFYWLWLQCALGAGAEFKDIIEYFGSVKAFYEAGETEWRMCPELLPKQVSKLIETKAEDVETIVGACKLNGWQIICYDSERYPERLREISNPPAVLYCDGELPDIDNSVTIGIVGTRKASDYAVKVADVMSRGVAGQGAVVVSGGALGVDTAAHRGAMLAGGKTVAVLGCGLGTNYLMENKPLREAVSKNGALVTEFPPFTKASRYTFPIRNRIISGLSLGVLVVEAGVKSGSLITANFALEQGRDVYAVPCSILESEFAGTNKLLDDGAALVTKPSDLIYPYAEEFGLNHENVKSVKQILKESASPSANVLVNKKSASFENIPSSRAQRNQRQQKAHGLTGANLEVYSALEDDFLHIDEIKARTTLDIGTVLTALTALEIGGLVQSAGGKRYKLS